MGIKRICIPIKPSELTIAKVEPYLYNIYCLFEQNAMNIRNNYSKYCLQHDILAKQRPHEDTEINNIVLEPHIAALVDFKTGYAFGNPIKYAQSKSLKTDDIEYLNKYSAFSHKRTVDKEVGTWAYATGVGYYFIQPTSNTNVDVEYESPYELYCLPADSCTKVYSSYLGNKPLFDVLFATYDKISESGTRTTETIVSIYLPDTFYEYIMQGSSFIRISEEPRFYKKLPLVEKRVNRNGIGIVEKVVSLQNAIDQLASMELDNVEEVVNAIFVYENVNLGNTPEEVAGQHRAMCKNGAVVLNSTSTQFPSKLSLLKTELNHGDINILYNTLKQEMYDAVGVPLASSAVTSGGDTGSARQLGNGWENAYNRLLDDINSFLEADQILLEDIIAICKEYPDNKVNDLHASEIEIKYSPNMSDNMQVKAQAYVNYTGGNAPIPPEIALSLINATSDPITIGKAIKEWGEQLEEKKQSQENAKMTQNPVSNNGTGEIQKDLQGK